MFLGRLQTRIPLQASSTDKNASPTVAPPTKAQTMMTESGFMRSIKVFRPKKSNVGLVKP